MHLQNVNNTLLLRSQFEKENCSHQKNNIQVLNNLIKIWWKNNLDFNNIIHKVLQKYSLQNGYTLFVRLFEHFWFFFLLQHSLLFFFNIHTSSWSTRTINKQIYHGSPCPKISPIMCPPFPYFPWNDDVKMIYVSPRGNAWNMCPLSLSLFPL